MFISKIRSLELFMGICIAPTLLHEAPGEYAAPETKLVQKRNEGSLLAAGDGGMCKSSDIDVLGSNVLAAISENDPRSLIKSTIRGEGPYWICNIHAFRQIHDVPSPF